jgi:hypothetical protein
MLKRLVPLLLLPVLTCACASQPVVGQHLIVSGKLVLRGNDPFTVPVVYDATGPWELEGVAREDASRLQNTDVAAEGDVSRTGTAGQLPALKVGTLKAYPR